MEKIYTFINRTTHRDNGGGFEKWTFKVKEQDFLMVCDIRTPGLILSHLDDTNNNNDCMACFVDVFDIKDDKEASPIIDFFAPKNTDATLLPEITENILDLLLNVIKPARPFCYITFLDSEKENPFYKNLLSQISVPVEDTIYKKIVSTLNEDNKKLIEEGLLYCYTGKLNG